MHKWIIVALAVTGTACFRYEPVTAPAPEQGQPVRVSLTYGGTESLRQYVGPNVETLSGRFLGRADSAVSLSVMSVSYRDGDGRNWAGETVQIPRSAIDRIEVKRFSRTRTLFMGLLAVAGAIAVNEAFGGPGNPHGQSGGPPPPPQ